MKQSPQMQKAQENMAAGVLTLDGFLGTDKRLLADIIIDDEASVRRLGLSLETIADRMEYFRRQGAEGLGEYIEVDGNFEVRVDSVRGKLPCPWEDGLFSKTNTIVNNIKLNKSLVYTDLHIHLIRAHGFFEGNGSRYRLEPAFLAEVLEIAVQ